MKADTGEHSHCFCTSNAGGTAICCRCGGSLPLAVGVREQVGQVTFKWLTWLDKNLFFVNDGTKDQSQ